MNNIRAIITRIDVKLDRVNNIKQYAQFPVGIYTTTHLKAVKNSTSNMGAFVRLRLKQAAFSRTQTFNKCVTNKTIETPQ